MQRPLILASKSPRRRALLKTLGIPFRVMPSHVAEHSRERQPHKRVQELALRKAQSVAKRLKRGTVIGADTLVFLRAKPLGQPKDAKEAYRMLSKLAGTTHQVLTGVVVIDIGTGKWRSGYAQSNVRMKKMLPEMIYKLSQKHLDKAGSYAIQEKKDPVAKVVTGSYDNVVGLPVALVKKLLK